MAWLGGNKSRVQGTPDPRLILVPHKSGYTGRRRLLFTVALLLTFAGGFAAGGWQSRHKMEAVQPGEILELIAEKAQLESELQEYRYLASHSRHDKDLEQVTVEQVRQENLQKQRRISELETELAFYRSIMAPEDSDEQGLIIEKFELEPLAEQNRFRFKLVLIQVENIRSLISGQFDLILVGTVGNERREVSLAQLSQPAAVNQQFKFRYFQSINGEITLPDGMVPEYVRISAQTQGRNAVQVDRKFDWTL